MHKSVVLEELLPDPLTLRLFSLLLRGLGFPCEEGL